MRLTDSRSVTVASAPREPSRFWVAALCALGSLAAAPASAQPIQVTLTSFAGRASPDLTEIATTTAQPVTQAECDAGALVGFRFSAIDITRAQLHFYSGTACEMSSVRNDNTDMRCTDLMIEYSINNNTEVNQDIPISDLIDCMGTSGTEPIYVLALDNSTSEVSGAGQLAMFPIAFDFVGPAAPQGLTARPGQSRMSLAWTASTDQIDGYDVFFIPGGCDAMGSVTAAATERLLPDNLAEADIIGRITGSAASGQVAFPDTVAIGTWSAVAIRGVDSTGNKGAVSPAVCVQRIEITTWFDTYCSGADRPAACDSSGCSVGPGHGPGTAALAMALLALCGLVWRRRR